MSSVTSPDIETLNVPAPASGTFNDGMHYFPVRIYFEDTDTGGVVYHANYLRYMERARSDMLRLLGIEQRTTLEAGEGVYAVTRVSIEYRAPARLEDDLVIISSVAAITPVTVTIAQRIVRKDVTITDGTVTVAFISPQGRPKRQPKDWVALFTRIAQGKDDTQ